MIPNRRALARLATLAPLVALLGALPARADEPVHSQATPRRAVTGGGLLFLSFVVPLPLPLALVAPPASSRPPVETSSRQGQPTRQAAAAPAAPGERLARRAALPTRKDP